MEQISTDGLYHEERELLSLQSTLGISPLDVSTLANVPHVGYIYNTCVVCLVITHAMHTYVIHVHNTCHTHVLYVHV